MVELARLESVYRRNPIEGSNPSSSAEKFESLQVVGLKAFFLPVIFLVAIGMNRASLSPTVSNYLPTINFLVIYSLVVKI